MFGHAFVHGAWAAYWMAHSGPRGSLVGLFRVCFRSGLQLVEDGMKKAWTRISYFGREKIQRLGIWFLDGLGIVGWFKEVQ